MEYNWSGKLRSASGADSISLKYDPMGNRVYKEVPGDPCSVKRKYIVDIAGKLPVILLVMDAGNNNSVERSYVYAGAQPIAFYDGDYTDPAYIYLHDRLGSVRQVIDSSGNVKNTYTYTPFGQDPNSQFAETVDNPFMFTGQWYDSEIAQYYLRARMYDPQLMRFTSIDPVSGKYEKPMTFHVFLYCWNNPINKIDPSGLYSFSTEETENILDAAVLMSATYAGTFDAFWDGGVFDFWDTGHTFQLGRAFMQDTEFGNYCAGYATYYNDGFFGDRGVRGVGHFLSMRQYGTLDDPDSKYFISAGILKAQADLGGARGFFGRLTFVHAKVDLMHGYDRIASTDLNSDEFWQEIDNTVTFWNAGELVW